MPVPVAHRSPSRLRPPLAAGVLAIAAACASTPPNLDDDMIVPGERVGRIELGMPLSQLLAVAGTPPSTAPIEGTDSTSYSFDGFTVGADDKVYWIVVEAPRFRTANGVAPGSEQIFARAAFGKPDCVIGRGDSTRYDYRNLYFDVDNATGKVTRLGVLKKTDTCRS